MNRSEAEALGVEALELANSGAWGELLAMELPGQVLELIRSPPAAFVPNQLGQPPIPNQIRFGVPQ